MNSKEIVWKPSVIEELRYLLEAESEAEGGGDDGDFPFPWPLTISQSYAHVSADGTTHSAVVISFPDVEGADDYEIRLAISE